MIKKTYFVTDKGYYIQLEHYRYSVDCHVFDASGRVCEFISKDTAEEIEDELLTFFWYGGFEVELGEFGSIEECIRAHKNEKK